MARRIATVDGIALRPGVSRNGRLYTRDMIARAVAEAQDRINSGEASFRRSDDQTGDLLSQRTHHAAEDDSTRIVGRLTSLKVNGVGEAVFTADIADTQHARTIDKLVRPKGDPNDPDEVDPFLKGVSIRGAWSGKVQTVMHDGMPVEKGENLHIYGLDYTGTPGVPGAEITGYRAAGSQTRESDDRVLIYESIVEGHVDADETATEDLVTEKGTPALKSGKPAAAPTKAPTGSYADPGYQDDKAKRYPLDTKQRAKAAWGYINQAKQAKNYTAAQLKRIKGRIKAALTKFGVEITDESWLITRERVSESVLEGMSWGMDDDRPGSFSVNLDNGMVCVTVSSYCVDPRDLDALGTAAMTAACAALEKMDPDMDGDIDVDGAPSEDTDHDMESKPDDDAMETVDITITGNVVTEQSFPDRVREAIQEAAPEPVADDNKEEAAVSEPTAPASEKPAAATETTEPSGLDALSVKFDKLTDAIAGLVTKMAAPAPVAATESVVEAPAAPVVTETEDQRIARLVAEQVAAQKTAMIQELVESGYAPSRKGLVAPAVTEAALGGGAGGDEYPANWPTENGQPLPPHKLSEEQFRSLTRPMLEQAVLGNRSIYRQQ